MMNLALNNATNVAQYYKDLGENVAIDVVTFGPGLHMLRDDTSPVKARIKAISESNPSISFQACANTRDNMSRAESKEVPLMSEAKIVKSGVVRVMELQELAATAQPLRRAIAATVEHHNRWQTPKAPRPSKCRRSG